MFKVEAGYAYKRYAYEKTKKKAKTKTNKQNKKKACMFYSKESFSSSTIVCFSDKFDTIKSPTSLKITNYSCIVPIVSANFPY